MLQTRDEAKPACAEHPCLLGWTNPCPTAVQTEPFFTSVFKVIIWNLNICYYTTKICTRVGLVASCATGNWQRGSVRSTLFRKQLCAMVPAWDPHEGISFSTVLWYIQNTHYLNTTHEYCSKDFIWRGSPLGGISSRRHIADIPSNMLWLVAVGGNM